MNYNIIILFCIILEAQAVMKEEEEDIAWSDNEDEDEEIHEEQEKVIEEVKSESINIIHPNNTTTPNDPGAGSPPSDFYLSTKIDEDTKLDTDLDAILNDDDLADVEPDMTLEEIEFDDDYDDWE